MNLQSVPGAWTYCLPLKGGQSLSWFFFLLGFFFHFLSLLNTFGNGQ